MPPKIDPTVTMMQVEEKPDVTYSDVGGCKEQIEKLREVVETPLLHVSIYNISLFVALDKCFVLFFLVQFNMDSTKPIVSQTNSVLWKIVCIVK